MSSKYKDLIGGLRDTDNLSTRGREEGTARSSLLVIDIDRIEPDPNNPRSDVDPQHVENLANSMRSVGQQTPIKVRWNGTRWTIIQGHTRWRAAQQIGLTSLRAEVEDRLLTETDRLTLQVIENCCRQDMCPLDEARSFKQLMDAEGLNGKQLAERIGVSESKVCRQLKLLKLPAAQQEKIKKGEARITEARAQVVRQSSGRRRGPDPVRLRVGGLTVQIAWRRAADRTTVADALDQVRDLAEQLDREQQKKGAA
jgi:ParB family chromosome partitioning protein